MKKLKILRICPGGENGLMNNLIPFSRALEKKGIETKFWFENKDFFSKSPFSSFRAGFFVTQNLNLSNIDVVHVHNPSYWGALFKLKSKVPTIVTFHGSWFYTVKHFWVGNVKQNLYYILSGLLSIIFAKKVIFTNKRDYLFFSKFCGKTSFVPTGFDLKIFNNNKRERKIDALFVGRDTKNKNLPSFLNIVKKFKLSSKVIIGDSKYSKQELAKIYNNSKYIFISSFYEGFSKVLLEAIACGCIPVVSECCESNLNHFGIKYIKINNFNPSKAISSSSGSFYQKRFAWETVADKTLDVYLSALGLVFKPNEKVLIVEPHNDDAFLSLGGTILKHGMTNFTIASVIQNNACGSKRIASLLENFKNLQLGFENIHNGDSTKLFFEKNHLTKKQFENKLLLLSRNFDKVLLPVGLYHPAHLLFSEIKIPSMRYLDLPYADFREEKRIVRKYSCGKEKISINIVDFVERKIEIIENAFDGNVKKFVTNGPAKRIRKRFSEIIFNPIKNQ